MNTNPLAVNFKTKLNTSYNCDVLQKQYACIDQLWKYFIYAQDCTLHIYV
jgi:hypothetical protein